MDRVWMREALCAQSSPDLWFPEGSLHEVNAEARRICKKCPVIDECLASVSYTHLTLPTKRIV